MTLTSSRPDAAENEQFAPSSATIAIAAMTFVIGLLFIPETKDRDIFTYDENPVR